MAPHSPKTALDGPKMAQDSPTTGAGQLKTGPGQPKTAQDSPGQPKTVPRRAQDSPRQAQSKFYFLVLEVDFATAFCFTAFVDDLACTHGNHHNSTHCLYCTHGNHRIRCIIRNDDTAPLSLFFAVWAFR